MAAAAGVAPNIVDAQPTCSSQGRNRHVVDVVGIAIVGRTEGDDRLELGRAARGDLQAVEAAPGDADHACGAGTPGLGGDPGEHLEGIILLLTAGTRRTGCRRSRRCRACRRGRWRSRDRRSSGGARIAARGPVVLAVRDVFEDGRHRVLFGVSGSQMRAARRQPSASGIQVFSILRTWRGNVVDRRLGLPSRHGLLPSKEPVWQAHYADLRRKLQPATCSPNPS